MAQRYDVGGHDCYMDVEQDGAWVKYKDYAVLHDLLREVLDNIDPEWDLAGGTQDKLEKMGLL